MNDIVQFCFAEIVVILCYSTQKTKIIKHSKSNFKTSIKGLLIAILVVFGSAIGYAQQPAHFMLGEDQFRGIQIYDIIQDKELNYWIATNDGLYFYDYQNMKKVACNNAKSNSVFNFKKNKNGVIYCHNLNNQIFEIKNQECNLFYELNDKEAFPDMSLTISADDRIVVGAKIILVIDTNKKILQRFDKFDSYLAEPFLGKQNEIYFPISGFNYLIEFKNNQFYRKSLVVEGQKSQNYVLKFFVIANQYYAIDLLSQKLFEFDIKNRHLKLQKEKPIRANQRTRFYETGNEVWLAGTLPGVDFFQHSSNALFKKNLFKDYYISNVFKDEEGNYLLSTFDKGIIVIPDLNVPEVIQSFREDPITATFSDPILGLLLGTSKGKLIHYSNAKMSVLSETGLRSIEQIFGSLKSEFILFDDGQIRAFNKKSRQMIRILEKSLKDAVFVSENKFYLGTNMGIYKVAKVKNNYFELTFLNQLNYRIHSLSYDEANKKIFAATTAGLFEIDSNDSAKLVLHEGKRIFSNNLYQQVDRLFATDNNVGLLVFRNGKIIDTITPLVNGKKELVQKMKIYEGSIYAKTSNGFYQFDMKGNVVKHIQSVFGFEKKRVIDFSIHEKQLWVSHSGGLQQIDFQYYSSNLGSPTLRINQLFINDIASALSEKRSLKSKERKISFELCSQSLRNRESTNFHYRLLGYDEQWHLNNYTSNTITYNALAPGEYTFEVKAENQGKYSETVVYSFRIAPPYYAQWWFIVAAMLLFILVVLLIFRWQINLHRKESQQINELNTSKLTAIKSQMNPHFIFNSLNSIQDLILKGDVENSYSYITTFSNLVRNTLNHSEQEFIDFEQEIKLLELYLSLEKLRFKENLKYRINTNRIEDVMLPPLIIQPFIENALVHGLLHKEGEKKLRISFEIKDALICTIEDNGVGRAKAKAIKQRQRSNHESFSGKAIRNRFEILSKIFDGQFGYEYEDLFENEMPLGTKVILTIPIKHKF